MQDVVSTHDDHTLQNDAYLWGVHESSKCFQTWQYKKIDGTHDKQPPPTGDKLATLFAHINEQKRQTPIEIHYFQAMCAGLGLRCENVDKDRITLYPVICCLPPMDDANPDMHVPADDQQQQGPITKEDPKLQELHESFKKIVEWACAADRIRKKIRKLHRTIHNAKVRAKQYHAQYPSRFRSADDDADGLKSSDSENEEIVSHSQEPVEPPAVDNKACCEAILVPDKCSGRGPNKPPILLECAVVRAQLQLTRYQRELSTHLASGSESGVTEAWHELKIYHLNQPRCAIGIAGDSMEKTLVGHCTPHCTGTSQWIVDEKNVKLLCMPSMSRAACFLQTAPRIKGTGYESVVRDIGVLGLRDSPGAGPSGVISMCTSRPDFIVQLSKRLHTKMMQPFDNDIEQKCTLGAEIYTSMYTLHNAAITAMVAFVYLSHLRIHAIPFAELLDETNSCPKCMQHDEQYIVTMPCCQASENHVSVCLRCDVTGGWGVSSGSPRCSRSGL